MEWVQQNIKAFGGDAKRVLRTVDVPAATPAPLFASFFRSEGTPTGAANPHFHSFSLAISLGMDTDMNIMPIREGT